MKRVLFTVLMLMGLCFSVSAQREEIFYFMDSKGQQQQEKRANYNCDGPGFGCH